MRGLILAGTAAALTAVLAAATFGVASTVTVILAAGAVVSGAVMMHRGKEAP
ncbi:hypothetical protein ACWGJ9_10345 [Curtobacterium citreum]